MPSANYRISGFTGLDDLKAVLLGLPKEVQDHILHDAMGPACVPIEEAARSFAPKLTGALASSIAHKVISGKGRAYAMALIGPARDYFLAGVRLPKRMLDKRANKSLLSRPANYAHLVEFGHKTKGAATPAHPFMRPAVAFAGGEMTGLALAHGIEVGIDAAVQRLAKKSA